MGLAACADTGHGWWAGGHAVEKRPEERDKGRRSGKAVAHKQQGTGARIKGNSLGKCASWWQPGKDTMSVAGPHLGMRCGAVTRQWGVWRRRRSSWPASKALCGQQERHRPVRATGAAPPGAGTRSGATLLSVLHQAQHALHILHSEGLADEGGKAGGRALGVLHLRHRAAGRRAARGRSDGERSVGRIV